ncbi:MAG: HPF/RaiA family ribosome-associated protein [Phycisphaerales bacterium]|nr:HPF/RaiA family ribosome-associated protein [Phycisphaerales bacterium]
MQVDIQAVNFKAEEKLLELVKSKMDKIESFYANIIHAKVLLKIDNVAHHIKDKVVEIKVSVPKHDFFATESTKSFEESFEGAYQAIIRQVKELKEKQH